MAKPGRTPKNAQSIPYSGGTFGGAFLPTHTPRYIEAATRDTNLAQDLEDFFNRCPEAGRAINLTATQAFSNGEGDERGYTIDNYAQEDWGSKPPLSPSALAHAQKTAEQVTLWQSLEIVERFLMWGDAFALVEILGSPLRVGRLRLLPTWQMFAWPDIYTGEVALYTQQLPNAIASKPIIMISPIVCVHWKFRSRHLYGRSLFFEALNDWEKLQRIDNDIALAARESAISTKVHEMPPGTDDAYRNAYKQNHDRAKREKIVSDLYLSNGAKAYAMGNPSGSLAGLSNIMLDRLKRISMLSGVPPYLLLAGLDGSKDIATEPARAFARQIGIVRQLFSYGMRQYIDLSLALAGYPPQNMVGQPYNYRFVWPSIKIGQFAGDESETEEDNALDRSPGGQDFRSLEFIARSNGNGHR